MKHALLLLLLLLVIGCLSVSRAADAASSSSAAEQITFPKIDRHPPAEPWRRGALKSLPHYDPESQNPFQVDLRAYDLSHLDLRDSLDDLSYAIFDDATVWPPDDRMPEGFDRERIMELGKNPGLGIRALHERGITGRGVGIAIIDQPLLTEHEEYADRLRFYEEISVTPDTGPAMHGAAVASIAVGKTVGVAPEADLYFIGTWAFDNKARPGESHKNLVYKARGIRRILEINKQLPEDRKIRVISISAGWGPNDRGYDEIMAANKEAIDAGLLVVSSSIEDTHKLDFFMLGRAPLNDPDDFNSCDRVLWRGYDCYRSDQRLLVPCDSRTTASPSGKDEYAFYRIGGASWSIPYIAGVYALAAQVDPTITPNRFWELAMKTGRTAELERDGQTVRLRPIIDAAAIVEALQKQ